MNVFFIIRMWAPQNESADSDKPHYVARVERETGAMSWTVSRTFSDANVFKKERPAKAVVRSVRRIADRVSRGWLYEIIRIQEDIVATNVPRKESA